MTGAIEGLLGAPQVDRLGRALLHSLWEGAVVGLVLAALRRAPAASRYWHVCAALGLMAILPGVRIARDDAREGERRIEAASRDRPLAYRGHRPAALNRAIRRGARIRGWPWQTGACR